MPERRRRLYLGAGLYGNGFLLGAIIMGFEMLGSRYLSPYFGGTIVTWAALISAVLAALMLGYFAGGALADRWPSPKLLALLIAAAAAYVAVVPVSAKPVLLWVWEVFGDGALGVIAASSALLLLPLTLMAMFSPYAIKLLLISTEMTGRIAGRVYAVSTLGSIFGTLATTFWLIPNFGSRNITYFFAGLLALSAVSVLALGKSRNSGATIASGASEAKL